RDDLRVQRRLIAAAAEWVHSKHDSSFLASGARPMQFEALAATGKLAFNQLERQYLQTSVSEREAHEAAENVRQQRELELARQATRSQRQSANRLRYLVVMLAVFLVIATGLSVFALAKQA